MPGGGFIFRQISVGQSVGQIPARADLLAVRHQAGDGRSVFEQNESDVLIMRAVDAIGKIARGVRHADTRLSHKIRLSDFPALVNPLRPDRKELTPISRILHKKGLRAEFDKLLDGLFIVPLTFPAFELLPRAQEPLQTVAALSHTIQYPGHQDGDGGVGAHQEQGDKHRLAGPEQVQRRRQEQEVKDQT